MTRHLPQFFTQNAAPSQPNELKFIIPEMHPRAIRFAVTAGMSGYEPTFRGFI